MPVCSRQCSRAATTASRLTPESTYTGTGSSHLVITKDSVADVTQIVTLDLDFLTERAGRIPVHLMAQVDAGLTLVLDL
jgi:mRNA-degrading endonuclease toxin of MazEF toxin-antitoxin module